MENQIRTATDQQKGYLDLLAIGYYVVGGLAGLVSCFALIYLVLGGVMLFRPQSFQPDQPPAFVGCILFALGSGLLLAGWTYAATAVYAGRCLAQRRKHSFILVLAVVSCLFAPFGTILGILTIVLLVQPEVKALFETPAPTAPAAG
jgi:hypothetical protein